MNFQHFPSSGRGLKDIGWLQSNFFFSFSEYRNPMRSAFGTLLAFNDDFVAAGKGFGLHPHANMEIISVMLNGSMNHKDSMGYTNVVHEDWVQIMSAGTGLRHEEYNVGDDTVNFLQIWIQPKLQNVTPRYQYRHFPRAERRNRLVTIVSPEEGAGHCWINQNTRISLGLFDAGGATEYRFNPENKCLFLFVMSGAIDVAGQALPARDAIGIWDTGEIRITAKGEAEFLLIETPINQK
ncbi:pirin family protein [Flaviaesturariibacter flavus]|uniref:Pirin family protein n=1 Tax=Flaviaesturariibacter flavus TaxID=2502780 RepID=A0A4R1BNN6_9BACT|nr:pirin family protein [Flaviaesturariibacter flavus]TCJ19164.1 pirin family protein [Flaviaesturariibacter flavus]